MLLDQVGAPWPKHNCKGIGGSGLAGWAAIDVLRANGISINASIMEKVFPQKSRLRTPTVSPQESIEAVSPSTGARVSLLAVARDILPGTKRTEQLATLGELGAKLLKLPKGKMWQLTLMVTDQHPIVSYTCILPERLGLPQSAKNKMVFAQLEARVAGGHAIWLVTEVGLV